MIKVELIIKCWRCGKEETNVQVFDDNIVDINLDKFCPDCNGGWMIKKGLTIKKLASVKS